MEKCRNEKGITLVALVITIVILIIIAAVSINTAFKDGGLLQETHSTIDETTNFVETEDSKMNQLLTEYKNIMAEDSNL